VSITYYIMFLVYNHMNKIKHGATWGITIGFLG